MYCFIIVRFIKSRIYCIDGELSLLVITLGSCCCHVWFVIYWCMIFVSVASYGKKLQFHLTVIRRWVMIWLYTLPDFQGILMSLWVFVYESYGSRQLFVNINIYANIHLYVGGLCFFFFMTGFVWFFFFLLISFFIFSSQEREEK